MSVELPADRAMVAAVLADVVSRGPRSSWPETLVDCCRISVRAAGVGLTVTDATGPVGVAAATHGPGRLGADLQFALGEGPCRTAAQTGRIVRVPDLAVETAWVEWSREAVAAGIRSLVSVPLLVGVVRVGVLDAYRDVAGPFSADDDAALLVHAEAATAVLLLSRAQPTEQDTTDVLELADIRPVVHQAAGMVAVQVDLDLDLALLRMRAHAFASGRPLREVAADVVARRLVFDRSDTGFRSEMRDDDGRT